MERSIISCCLDEMPIFMTRLVDDSGARIQGMPEDEGSSATAMLMRSCTRWRASMRSVPILNRSTICDSPSTEEERMTSTFGTPRSESSRTVVMRFSTSAAVMPTPSVWISTLGGANSGKTSTGMRRICCVPNTRSAPASARTRKRNLRLEPMIQRNINALPAAPSRGSLSTD